MCPLRAIAAAHDVTLTFPPDPVWVRNARDAVRTAMGTLVSPKRARIETAALLTSEAVTNAVVASANSVAPEPVSLRACWSVDGEIHVRVQDSAPGVPVVPGGEPPALEQEYGRGLLLIALEATEWGVCRHMAGRRKAVWFSLW